MIREYIPEPIKSLYRIIRAKLLSMGLARSATFDQPEEEIEASKDISIIVAIHDSPQVTQRCLESIEKYAANAEVILVDDGSRLQETTEIIRDYQQRNVWILVQHIKSLGHSRSCEAGAKLATRQYLCFLNSDTVITPWSWYGAKDAFESDPTIAVTGPSTSWAASKQTIRRAKYCRNYWTDSQIYAFARRYVSSRAPKSWVDLQYVAGFAFFIRRDVWNELGDFDPNLPDYGNESELCNRLTKRGFRVVWTQNNYIHHFGQGSYACTMSQDAIQERRLNARVYINSLHKNKGQV